MSSPSSLTPLPIDPLLPSVAEALRRHPCLVLEAAPGAGKTTRVPRALLEQGCAGGKEIWVLEPRRLATRLAATRVAEELGERVGETVGYQIRFEDVGSARTRIRFVTEGILTRKLVTQPRLDSVGVVVLDEFHERHLAGDLGLALLRRLQQTERPDLKLVVMSATLQTESLRAFLGDAPLLSSEGRRFDVGVEYLSAPDERHLDQQVLAALKRLVPRLPEGHVLVFLPGAGEIRRTRDACADFASRHGFDVLPLHGELPTAEQDRAVRPSARRKLILSTNVAETSLTIDGVTAVVDSGLARVASFSAWSGLPSLKIAKVSQASAIQRMGRAGRTREGICLRLYTQHDFDGRAAHDAPEIRRVDLADTVLALRALGVRDVATFPFFEAPPRAALDAADALLRRLGALTPDGDLSALGKRMQRAPIHPRLARLVAEGERRGVSHDAAKVAALLSERDVRKEARASLPGAHAGGRSSTSGPSDVLELLDRWNAAAAERLTTAALQRAHLDAQAVQTVERVRQQLSRGLTDQAERPRTPADWEQALLLCVLAGFPDRVARRRKKHAPELLLVGGGTATLADTSVVKEEELLVALDVEERSGVRGGARTQVRIASKVEAEWLLDLYPDALSEEDALVWSSDAARVERVMRLAYEQLTLEESRTVAPASEGASRVLAEAALAAGLNRFIPEEQLEQWTTRLELVSGAFPEAGLPRPDADFWKTALTAACEGLRSFDELRASPVLEMLQSTWSSEQRRLLSTVTPERLSLPGGRQVTVHYERGKPPWMESRLQDFFGLTQGPSVCQGRVPVVLHLLAPNQRAVQVTTDLAGFWDRHYPALRKELARKYPRHSWPENPRTAQPPAALGRRY